MEPITRDRTSGSNELWRWSARQLAHGIAAGGSSTQPPGPGRVAAASGPHVPLA